MSLLRNVLDVLFLRRFLLATILLATTLQLALGVDFNEAPLHESIGLSDMERNDFHSFLTMTPLEMWRSQVKNHHVPGFTASSYLLLPLHFEKVKVDLQALKAKEGEKWKARIERHIRKVIQNKFLEAEFVKEEEFVTEEGFLSKEPQKTQRGDTRPSEDLLSMESDLEDLEDLKEEILLLINNGVDKKIPLEIIREEILKMVIPPGIELLMEKRIDEFCQESEDSNTVSERKFETGENLTGEDYETVSSLLEESNRTQNPDNKPGRNYHVCDFTMVQLYTIFGKVFMVLDGLKDEARLDRAGHPEDVRPHGSAARFNLAA